MLLSALLLLLVCGSQADNYYGTVMTYYPKDMTTNGSLLVRWDSLKTTSKLQLPFTPFVTNLQVNVRYKLSFAACAANDTWSCSGNCGSETADVELSVVEESPGEWCQREGVVTRLVSGTAPFQLSWVRFWWWPGCSRVKLKLLQHLFTPVEAIYRSTN